MWLWLQTPVSHADYDKLNQVVGVVEEIIAEVDTKTGRSKCQFHVGRLHYVDDRQVIAIFLILDIVSAYLRHCTSRK